MVLTVNFAEIIISKKIVNIYKPGRRASFFNLKAAYQGLVNSPNYQHHTWKIRCIPIISKQHINLGEIHILINGGQSLESYKTINLKLVENNYA